MSWTILRPDAVSVLYDKKARRALFRYFQIFEGKLPAKFLIARKLFADFDENSELSELFKTHEKLTAEFYKLQAQIDEGSVKLTELETPATSYLDLKIVIADRILESCQLCERKCKVNRKAGKLGYCKCPAYALLVSTIFEHIGEEPELVPSGTCFFMGCPLTCKHCQNWTISQWYETGHEYSPRKLAHIFDDMRKSGVRNINLVGGSPTPYLHGILETFKHVCENVPVVWNSNSYYSEMTAKLLAGFVDVYLLDFKYGDDRCAKRISNAPNYWDACTRNHLYAKKYGELIIRILVLPGHVECCYKRIIEWIADNLGKDTRVNIMWQYRPEWRAYEIQELRRRLRKDEMELTIEIAKEVGLTNFIT